MLVTSGEVIRRAPEASDVAVSEDANGGHGSNGGKPPSPQAPRLSILQLPSGKGTKAGGTLDLLVEARTPVRCHSLEATSHRIESELGLTLRFATSNATDTADDPPMTL